MAQSPSGPQTLFDKLWDSHAIVTREDEQTLLWVDRHFVHEGSFHAFNKLKERNAKVSHPDLTFGIADHYVPTRRSGRSIDPAIQNMLDQLERNTSENGVMLFGLNDPRQGIVHVVGPEQGLTLPGLLMVCGDSHTSTHGAFGAWGFGIGASEVAHVLMTQTLWQRKPKRMRISVDGTLAPGIGAKDIALSIIARIGADGAQGHAVEYAGSAIRALSMEGRHGGSRRDDDQLSPRPAIRAQGRGFRACGRGLAATDVRRGSTVRPRDRARCFRDRARRYLGRQPRGRAADHDSGAGS
jgi:3-isopropylmalate/(R)-2-methylmalate dehydratase large subunit